MPGNHGGSNTDEDYAPHLYPPRTNRPVLFNAEKIVPGVHVDRIDVAAGMRELEKIWPGAPVESVTVIQYALMRWARGEEAAAERGAIDQSFHGVDFGSWRRVLAAARATAETKHVASQLQADHS